MKRQLSPPQNRRIHDDYVNGQRACVTIDIYYVKGLKKTAVKCSSDNNKIITNPLLLLSNMLMTLPLLLYECTLLSFYTNVYHKGDNIKFVTLKLCFLNMHNFSALPQTYKQTGIVKS